MKKFILFLPVIAFASCNSFQSIKSALSGPSPYERYVESLKKADLLDSRMTREWLAASERALRDSVEVALPFSESGFFQAGDPQARGYKFAVRDGQVLTVKATLKAEAGSQVFMELFLRDETEWDRVAHADSTLTITYEFSSHEQCVLRLQPELLANAWYSIDISLTPVLINPVFGASNKSIGSFYGAPRDNGRRSHEGVDIFAPRGTPVLAPTEGYVSRVSMSRLGGKVVWLKDPKRGHSYYFAHLDSQMVKPGMHVRQGHVLGLVGNTGNAIRTPPHLHFGIYKSGAKDPLHYILQLERGIASMPIDTGFQQEAFKVVSKKISLFAGPSSAVKLNVSLERNSFVTVLGQSDNWYRVSLPDDTEGYLPKRYLTPLTSGIRLSLDSTVVLLSEINDHAIPIAVLAKATAVEVLARFGDFRYVRTENGNAGWIMI